MELQQVFQSRRTIVLSVIIGAAGILVLGIQPLLLGGLLQAGTVDTVQLGWIATTEVLGMAAGVFLGAHLLASARARSIAIGAGVLMAVANAATPHAPWVAALATWRLLAGVSEGAMMAAAILTITHSAAPGRLNAIYLTASAAPQLLFAYLMPVVLFPAFGVRSGFYVLAAVGLIGAVSAALVRDRFAPSADDAGKRIAWTWNLTLSLAATLITAAAIGACWSYAEPLGAQLGLTEDAIGVAVTVSLAFQITGSLAVALFGYRLPFRLVLPAGVLLQAASVAILIAVPSPAAFSFALAVFGFCWQACLPFAMDLVIHADATRATAPLVMPLTLVGLSLGPLIASALVGASVIGAFVLGIGGFVAAAALYVLIFGLNVATAKTA